MHADQLTATFSALADPTRRAILARLAKGETTVNELAAPFAISLPAVSRHLKVLEKAGLVAKSRTAQWRPCRLEAGPLKEAAGWIAHYRRYWDDSFDRLDAYLAEVQAPKTRAKAKPRSNPQSNSATGAKTGKAKS
ncbi:hypothetical protein sos41_18450 [Alphaproteobacteria bacterium SO-S41]|nr:hypothetical protein sos41_18450 [Alphaproteobacteria bacterium SO-S41]